MRVKKKKHGAERMAACGEIVINDLSVAQKNPKNLFDNDNPVRIEIGCGKGDFIVGTAKDNPDINFLAIEKVHDVLVMAAEKIKNSGLTNVRVCCCDAKELTEFFEEKSIDRIYLNFSDPWPKARHEKRRLTHRSFLEIYKTILKDDGEINFKTDNRPLFDFSVEEFKECNWELNALTYDLHNSEYAENNIMTEYERRFSGLGFSINRVEAKKPQK
ncbi:MAG: tRNA (guanosine(46)-N7)-methyltransferase TrmB [Clostridia bacterium]|nr:tRNA (guanosine(46)-N7)-methyltransferase TrmB [Clostridia bacterium]